jgi:hypothetical protein
LPASISIKLAELARVMLKADFKINCSTSLGDLSAPNASLTEASEDTFTLRSSPNSEAGTDVVSGAGASGAGSRLRLPRLDDFETLEVLGVGTFKFLSKQPKAESMQHK